MTSRVPDHDQLVRHISRSVRTAVDLVGWPKVRETCDDHNVSSTLLRKLYFWDERDPSFNLAKLLQAYDWACDHLPDDYFD